MSKSIEVIEPTIKLRELVKVAAYARVSTAKDTMLNSLSEQISHYNSYIQKNKEWVFAGIYADEAMTGTKDTRPEFQRMKKDCKEGKIDLIITKSISRFARNTLIALETIKELKSIGIPVYFEEQGFYSTSGECEMIMNIMASFYQEEARSMSENMKWRARKDMQNGLSWVENHFMDTLSKIESFT